MPGRDLFTFAVLAMTQAAREILEQPRLAADEISGSSPNQANRRIRETLARDLALPLDRFVINLDRYGNTSAASIPPARDKAQRGARINPGERALDPAFGAGLTCGSALIR